MWVKQYWRLVVWRGSPESNADHRKNSHPRNLMSVQTRIPYPSSRSRPGLGRNTWETFAVAPASWEPRSALYLDTGMSTARQCHSDRPVSVNSDVMHLDRPNLKLDKKPGPGELPRGHNRDFYTVEDPSRTRTVKVRARLARSQLKQSAWRTSKECGG